MNCGDSRAVLASGRRAIQLTTDHKPNEKNENHNMIIKESLKKVSTNQSDISENNFSFPLKEARENFEKSYLTSQLKKFKGNISRTADFVGMERSALHRKLKTLGIKGIN